MDWDDEDDSGYDDFDYGPKQEGPDSMDINNPSSAYFFFSDDAQDEISGNDSKNMKCLSCGYRFRGDIYDRCPRHCLTIPPLSMIPGNERKKS